MMDICEYDDQYKIVEERLCPEHKQDVTMRCSTCMRTICVECLDDDTACDGICQFTVLFFIQKLFFYNWQKINLVHAKYTKTIC